VKQKYRNILLVSNLHLSLKTGNKSKSKEKENLSYLPSLFQQVLMLRSLLKPAHYSVSTGSPPLIPPIARFKKPGSKSLT